MIFSLLQLYPLTDALFLITSAEEIGNPVLSSECTDTRLQAPLIRITFTLLYVLPQMFFINFVFFQNSIPAGAFRPHDD